MATAPEAGQTATDAVKAVYEDTYTQQTSGPSFTLGDVTFTVGTGGSDDIDTADDVDTQGAAIAAKYNTDTTSGYTVAYANGKFTFTASTAGQVGGTVANVPAAVPTSSATVVTAGADAATGGSITITTTATGAGTTASTGGN